MGPQIPPPPRQVGFVLPDKAHYPLSSDQLPIANPCLSLPHTQNPAALPLIRRSAAPTYAPVFGCTQMECASPCRDATTLSGLIVQIDQRSVVPKDHGANTTMK